LVCRCNSVTRERLQEAIADGAADLDDLAASTRAGTGCGGCRAELCELLESRAGGQPAVKAI
jgi:NAD(P)H-nitrite reductase large subunit